MYRIRPFRNTDPPRLVQLWASQPPQRGLAQPVNVGILEQYLFSKQYFDHEGLLVAEQGDCLVGFVHAGFGSNEEGTDLATDLGTTYMLMVRPDLRESPLPAELLQASENYLRQRGAKVFYAGGVGGQSSFYLGLYGGSELPGVLLSDTFFYDLVRRHAYHEAGRVLILHRDLVRFRAPITRDLRRLRRSVELEIEYGPSVANWWEASVYGSLDRIEFCLRQPRTRQLIARCSFWDIEPLASGWGVRAAGLDSE